MPKVVCLLAQKNWLGQKERINSLLSVYIVWMIQKERGICGKFLGTTDTIIIHYSNLNWVMGLAGLEIIENGSPSMPVLDLNP